MLRCPAETHGSASRGTPTASKSQLVELSEYQPVSLPSADGGQLVDQAALLGLELCLGVMSDKTGQPLLAMAAKEPRPVDWMESKPVQRRRMANVMCESRGYQHITVLWRQDRRHPLRLMSHLLDMDPAIAQGGNQL